MHSVAVALAASCQHTGLLQDYFEHRHGGKPPLFYPGGEFYYYQGYLPDKMQSRMRPAQPPLSCINSTLLGEPAPTTWQQV